MDQLVIGVDVYAYMFASVWMDWIYRLEKNISYTKQFFFFSYDNLKKIWDFQ